MSVTTLRPTSDDLVQAWSRSGGGTPLYQHMDNASAALGTYITASTGYPAGISWYVMGFNGESIVLGTTKKVKAIRIRSDVSDPGDPLDCPQSSFTLRDVNTARNITARDYFRVCTSGVLVQRSGAWHANNPDGRPWDQGNLNRLQVELYGYLSKSGMFQRVHSIYVDVDVKDAPTVSGIALDNLNTTRPIVRATYTAVEGDPLARVEIKVFTAAQVATPGFDPATTAEHYVGTAGAPIWDSGQRALTAINRPVEVDLSPGVTYYAYVRAAYLLNSIPFWSAWASQSFALAIEPPPTPTLTMTPDATLRRAILAFQAKVNLLTSDDADFESSIGNWIAGVGAPPIRSTAQARHGSASMLYSGNGTAGPFFTNSGGTGGPGAVVTKAGETYRLSGFIRAGTTGRAWRIVARQHDTSNNFVNQTNGSNVTDTTSWTALSDVTHIATVDGRLYFQLETSTSPPIGENHYFDQLQIVPGSTAVTWTPGYFSLSTARIDAWDRSTGMDNLARLELSACRAGITKRTAADGLTTDPANTFVGADAARWTPSATGSVLDFGYPLGPLEEAYALPVVGGVLVVASFYARASASGSYVLGIETHDVSGSGSTDGTATVTLTTTLARYSVSAVIAAGHVHGRLSLTNNTGGTGQQVHISAFQWEIRPAGSSTAPDPWVPGQGKAPNWQAIRGMGATVFPTSQQTLSLSDFEVPPGIARTYRARVDTTLPGLTTTMASTDTATSTAGIWLAPTGTWILKDPYFPERNAVVRVVGLPGEGIDPDVSIFHPAGAELPVPFTDYVGGINGSMTVLALGDTEWARLLPLLQAGSTMLLDLPEGGHRYYQINRSNWPRAGPLGQIQRQTSLDVTQVAKPPDLPAYSGLGFLSIGGGEPPGPSGSTYYEGYDQF